MASGSGGGGRDRRRRGRSPELPEEGELMLEVPAPPLKKGKASQDPSRFRFGQNLDEIQERLTKYVKSIPGHLLEQYELWLKSSQFESWTSEKRDFWFAL
ncbi:hypothetical protein R1flu_007293 [Riccia fluitans]|uniref:Uncharacterized protein n=1 Tax=Riccia fluitans TaxID=41844 RepID=A0ABD1Z145_9MARC